MHKCVNVQQSIVATPIKILIIATIEIKDPSVRERLGLKWVKQDVHTVDLYSFLKDRYSYMKQKIYNGSIFIQF